MCNRVNHASMSNVTCRPMGTRACLGRPTCFGPFGGSFHNAVFSKSACIQLLIALGAWMTATRQMQFQCVCAAKQQVSRQVCMSTSAQQQITVCLIKGCVLEIRDRACGFTTITHMGNAHQEAFLAPCDFLAMPAQHPQHPTRKDVLKALVPGIQRGVLKPRLMRFL